MNNEPFYDLYISKSGGNVICGTDNSRIYIRNQLEFKQDNVGVIDARTNDHGWKYGTRVGSDLGTVSVLHRAKGHVDGKLRMEIDNSGGQSISISCWCRR